MCGIVGLIYKNRPVDAIEFTTMRDTLAHRGPDDAHSEYFEQDRVALGHRKLAFLDLSEAGRQPLCNEDGRIWIVLNGEIYNYLELRSDLESRGHRFKTHTDTEVIVHGYEEWGLQVVDRLEGMFAFGLLDLNLKRLVLARDRFGIKPLYYAHQEGQFLFASELKAIIACQDVARTPDLSAMADYLVYRYVPSPKTIWQGIAKLPPAHLLVFDYDNFTAVTTEYWQIPFQEERIKPQELARKFGALFAESVALHARSDVPIGSFLSGGYDSSAIVHSLVTSGYRPETFAIGFEGWDDSEHRYAALVAEQLDVPFSCTLADESTLDLLDIMPDVYDEPVADISILPTWLVSREAAKRVKAVMSGDGADELLGGYWWQKKMFALHPPALTWTARMRRRFHKKPKEIDRVAYYAEAMAMGRFDRSELEKAFVPELHASLPADPDWFYRQHCDRKLSPLKCIQRLDIKCFLGELLLTKIDRASMAHSLEVRVPFLASSLFKAVLSAPETTYYRPDVTKYLLHANIRKHLPKAILDRPKQGFVGPNDFYMNPERYHILLDDSHLAQNGILRQEYIDALLEAKDHWRLWKIAVLENWYRRWVVGARPTVPRNCFVFVVCGDKKHLDTLHYSLNALARFSQQEIVVVTDSRRNQIPIEWPEVIDIPTPEQFDHHQASIYLKTALHRFLPGGRNYCYLDTDVVAIGPEIDTVFARRRGPITFAADHSRLHEFSPYAVTCDCIAQNVAERAELDALLLSSGAVVETIERMSLWRWKSDTQRWISPAGRDVSRLECAHLAEHIASKFGIKVTEAEWQHWNGGVFLFGDESHRFLEAWHLKTMQIFEDPAWRVRDQGTLVATVWEFGLENSSLLPKPFNFIVDYHKSAVAVSADRGHLTNSAFAAAEKPHFVHVLNHFGDRNWDVWNWIDQRVGSRSVSHESDREANVSIGISGDIIRSHRSNDS